MYSGIKHIKNIEHGLNMLLTAINCINSYVCVVSQAQGFGGFQLVSLRRIRSVVGCKGNWYNTSMVHKTLILQQYIEVYIHSKGCSFWLIQKVGPRLIQTRCAKSIFVWASCPLFEQNNQIYVILRSAILHRFEDLVYLACFYEMMNSQEYE